MVIKSVEFLEYKERVGRIQLFISCTVFILCLQTADRENSLWMWNVDAADARDADLLKSTEKSVPDAESGTFQMLCVRRRSFCMSSIGN